MFYPDWLNYATTFPLAFAQVREDALLDLAIIRQLPVNATALMIASGGCTVAVLAASSKLSQLHITDMNPAQLALTRVKLHLLAHYGKQERLALLGHLPMPAKERKEVITSILQQLGYPSGILGDIEAVSHRGADQAGRYEILFHALRNEITPYQDILAALFSASSISHQKTLLADSTRFCAALEAAFRKVMDLPNLIHLFGDEATQNAVMPFAEHFIQRTYYALHHFLAADNPYLAQMLLGRFTADSHYPWFELPQQDIGCSLHFHHHSMMDALFSHTHIYDFIHLSNILDWLSETQAKQLLEAVYNRLSKGGWIIIRQLNSNLDIPSLYPAFHWDKHYAEALHAKDRSFFYQKLHIARKL